MVLLWHPWTSDETRIATMCDLMYMDRSGFVSGRNCRPQAMDTIENYTIVMFLCIWLMIMSPDAATYIIVVYNTTPRRVSMQTMLDQVQICGRIEFSDKTIWNLRGGGRKTLNDTFGGALSCVSHSHAAVVAISAPTIARYGPCIAWRYLVGGKHAL